jgi:predicted GNAT family N-acyltransferase
MKYTYITDYKNNDKLRKSFNELTEKTFGINFIDWYSNGFWDEKYILHSLLDDEKVVSNVFVNLIDFDIDGTKKHYIQLGTIMTDEDYRGQGLSRYLMEKVIDEYKDKADGIYLFGNNSVINFYPRFGFVKGKEYQYSKSIDSTSNVNKIEHVNMSDKTNWKNLLNAVKNSVSNDRFTMDNLGILAFYVTGFMNESVYYLAGEDVYIIADVEEENLFIHKVIASHKVDLENVISSFGSGIKKVTLGFTPNDVKEYNIEELHIKNCTLFILGKDLENIEKKKLMFPTLSHA